VFPMIGQLSYLLTLPPYGFYWFSLAADAAPPTWSSATSGPVVEHHTFVLRRSISEIAENGARSILERDVLPPYVAQRRWFQQKDKKAGVIELARFGLIESDGRSFLYSEIAVNVDGRPTYYALPLVIAWEDDMSNPFEAPLALARVRRGARVGLLTDAFASPVLARAIIEGLRHQQRVVLSDGEIHFCPTDHFLEMPDDLYDAKLEWPAAEQTNSTMVVGRKMVIKLLRRLGAGSHPEGEMSRFLTGKGFDGTPALFGEMVRTDAQGETATIAIAQAYVFNQGDGWQWTIDRLSHVVDEGATPFTGPGEDRLGQYMVFARQTGRRIGQMHRLLAEPTDNPAFAAETVTQPRAAAIGKLILEQLDAALTAAKSARDSEATTLARELEARRNALSSVVAERAMLATGRLRTRIHGDLHLGQILIAGEDVQIIDFEGEPTKPLELRRRKALPQRDLAGMIRSFDYAASVVERQAKHAGGGESVGRAASILADFRNRAAAALLEGYGEIFGQPISRDGMALLELLMLEKAVYEICYEAANRPDWLVVPLKGALEIADRLLHEEIVLA
jgi:maltose alpha-D-glucosyltransferase / alpha-amylase